ncbi:MAG: HlyC/CorC family transporter [Nitrosopumilaceae archaeon]|nr:HlyC/CorC family transporter [Nitrosopumilaceae archaeon]
MELPWIEIILLSLSICLSAFFSGLEVALVSIRKSKVLKLVKDNVKGSNALHILKSNPSMMMASVNLGNNLVNVAATALATDISIKMFGDEGLSIAIGVMTFLLLVFGEITPKTYCNANATKIALSFSRILLFFGYSLFPIVKFFEIITKTMVKLTGSSYIPPPLTEEEIKGVIDQGLEDNAIEKQESKLVHDALDFDEIAIRTVMTSRTQMFTLNAKMMLFEALPLINKMGYSRIPVYDDNNKDEIAGIVHVRDILKYLEEGEKMTPLIKIARKPIFASREKKVSRLLNEMQEKQTHMAIVLDEFGGVEGCVTLEDLVEELVGEIHDEKDVNKKIFQKLDNNTIITSGDIEIDTINEIFKTHIPDGDDYSSLHGLLHEKLGDIPKEGDVLKISSLSINVKTVLKNKAEKIIIKKIN